MGYVHHVVTGDGQPPVVFVHGFACAHGDWDAQVAHLAPRHRCVAVDLRGHGASTGSPEQCSIERYGADVAELLHAVELNSAVLVGHSMGCRVVTETALQAPARVGGVVFLDGSQFAAGMADALRDALAAPAGYAAPVERWFREMFTADSNPAFAAAVVGRAALLPRAIGEHLITDLARYDITRLASSLADLRVPVMAIQATYSNERRERRPLRMGQTTPYLDMLRARIPAIRIEVIADAGHFPQLEQAAQVNALLKDFLAAHPARN